VVTRHGKTHRLYLPLAGSWARATCVEGRRGRSLAGRERFVSLPTVSSLTGLSGRLGAQSDSPGAIRAGVRLRLISGRARLSPRSREGRLPRTRRADNARGERATPSRPSLSRHAHAPPRSCNPPLTNWPGKARAIHGEGMPRTARCALRVSLTGNAGSRTEGTLMGHALPGDKAGRPLQARRRREISVPQSCSALRS